MKNLAEQSLVSLEALLADLDGKFVAKVNERDSKTAELLALDRQWKDGPQTDLRTGGHLVKCRDVGEQQYALNLEVNAIYASMKPIREAIIAMKNPL